MDQSKSRVVFDGAVAGLLGALVIAAWFLFFDAARGEPMATPSLLASAIIRELQLSPTGQNQWVLVGWYTVFHFVVLALIGVAVALMLDAAKGDVMLFGSVLIFVAAFQIFFITFVMLLGPGATAALPWWKIIIGNLMATATVLLYFLWRRPALARNLLGPWLAVAWEGVCAGVLGAAVLALWFLAYDAAAGHLLRTPAMLGAAVFGVGGGEAPALFVPLVLGYTALHFFAFIVFGLVAAVLLDACEREPLFTLGVIFVFACFEVFFVGALSVFDQAALRELGWWKILAGNLLALTAIVAYFTRRHPSLKPRLVERWAHLQTGGARQRS